MNMYRWCIVNKHGGWAFVANDFLTRTLRSLWSPMYSQTSIKQSPSGMSQKSSIKYGKNGTVAWLCIQYNGVLVYSLQISLWRRQFFLWLAASEVNERGIWCALQWALKGLLAQTKPHLSLILAFMYIKLYLMGCWKKLDMVRVSLCQTTVKPTGWGKLLERTFRKSTAVGSCLMIYKLKKLSDQRLWAEFSLSSPSENSELKPSMHLEFQMAFPPSHAFRIPA